MTQDDAEQVPDELLGEKDLFRLVIRGFALISDELDEAIANAFGGSTPRVLNRLRLPARLALARALGAVTPELSVAIQRLGRIRHRLAHTRAGEVTDEEVRGVWDAIAHDGELEGTDPNEFSPGDQLRLAVSAIWTEADYAASEVSMQRRETEKALAGYREREEARQRQLLHVEGVARSSAEAARGQRRRQRLAHRRPRVVSVERR